MAGSKNPKDNTPPPYPYNNPEVYTDPASHKKYYPCVMLELDATDKDQDAEAFARGLIFKVEFFDTRDKDNSHIRFGSRDRAERWMDDHGLIQISTEDMERMRNGEKIEIKP
jgi:hypothetical protein